MRYYGKNLGENIQAELFLGEEIEWRLPAEHFLVKMNKLIPWEEIVKEIGKEYSLKGNKSNSIRMMIGLELGKREMGISDEKIVQMLSSDIALQYFCGFKSFGEEASPDSSSMTNFRKRISPEIFGRIERLVARALVPYLPKRRRGQMIVDTTCIEANVTFPTDTKLLKKTFQKLVGVAEKIREKGKEIIIRGKQKLIKEIRGFDLQRKKGKKVIIKMRKKILRACKKLEKKIFGVIRKRAKEAKKSFVSALQDLKESGKKGAKKIIQTLNTAKKIIKQQEKLIELAKKKIYSVEDRIVSFHEPKVRPIVRGKEGKNVEFGSKGAISVIGGFLGVSHNVSSDNYSDSHIVEDTIETFKKIRGKDPTEIVGDRGFHSPKNHNLLKEKGIRDGLEYRGKVPKKHVDSLPEKKTLKRMKNQRSVVEGRIGNLKKMGQRCQYQTKNMQAWVSVGMIMGNLRWAASRI